MKAALYIRVSTQRQSDRGTPEVQINDLRKYATQYGFDIYREYQDAFTGDAPLHQRPIGKELLTDAKNKLFDTVLVWKIDRFGRDLVETLNAERQLKSYGIRLISITENIDTARDETDLIFQITGAFAQYEKKKQLERMVAGRDRTVQHGKYRGGPVSLGYDVDPLTGKLQLSIRIVPELNCTESELALSIFKNISQGSTLVAECERLNNADVPAIRRYSKGGIVDKHVPWLASRLSVMLQNRVYLGEYHFRSKRGKILQSVPALVTKELWNSTRQQLERNKHRRQSKHRLNLLKGLVQCHLCQGTFVAAPSYSYRKSLGKRIYSGHYYRCSTQVAPKRPDRLRCPAKQVDAEALEEWIWAGICEILHDPESAMKQAYEQLQARRLELKDLPTQREHLQNALIENQRQRQRILEWYRKGRLTDEEAEAQDDIIAKERAEIETHLHQLDFKYDRHNVFEHQYQEAGKILASQYDLVEAGDKDIHVKYNVIQRMTKRIIVSTEGAGRHKTCDVQAEFILGGARYQAQHGDIIPVNDFTNPSM